ncbi:MAG: translational GTPase TypA [Alphaproteobacteria bacterium]
MTEIRNLAIIAHVDHGKTTLVDSLLHQSGTFRENERVEERAMDSNELEKERGITILAKCTSINWGDKRFNIVDTPGHADFGGEVERILDMVDGVILLVDSAEGPMPQTKFVLTKALAQGLRPIVIINKIDRPDGRPQEVLDEVFELFMSLNATDEQLDFPILYAAARDGWAVRDLNDPRENMNPLFETIYNHIPAPTVDKRGPFKMLATILEYDNFVGRILTGKVYSGKVSVNDAVKALSPASEQKETGKATKLYMFKGLQRIPVDTVEAGDIVTFAGLSEATVGDTICTPSVTEALKTIPIDPPTLAMTFSVNDSPLAGLEGKKLTSRMIRDRLMHEKEINVSIRVTDTENKEALEVAGRGELQLGVLIETMRREGFELSISRPRVLFKKDETTGERLEPIEEVQIDVDEPYVGVVAEKMGLRKGEMMNMTTTGGDKMRLTFMVPTRGLIGYRSEFLTDTRGTGVMCRSFHGYAPHKGEISGRRNGVLLSTDKGKAVAYALWAIEERGVLFIHPGDEVYTGMIIGENSRPNDLEVNPLKGKKLSNVRASGKDEAIRLTPPREMTLETAISYIQSDELVEVTPENVRLRKVYLDPNDRKRAERSNTFE